MVPGATGRATPCVPTITILNCFGISTNPAGNCLFAAPFPADASKLQGFEERQVLGHGGRLSTCRV